VLDSSASNHWQLRNVVITTCNVAVRGNGVGAEKHSRCHIPKHTSLLVNNDDLFWCDMGEQGAWVADYTGTHPQRHPRAEGCLP
jgi:hypothetical protein